MTFNRKKHQRIGPDGTKWCALIQIFEAVFRKVLNVFCALLERMRRLFSKFLEPRWLSTLLTERVVALMRVACQDQYRNWIGFVKPQKNCAFELADSCLLFICNNNSGARLWVRLFTS